MPTDAKRVDQIVQFALARAAHEDDWQQRELGPIHLIKYVYLADLAHAAAHDGETFTGTNWVFFHYGPWSAEVHSRLDPAAAGIQAIIRTFESPKSEKDGKRYSVQSPDADRLERDLEKKLPGEVTSAVRRAVASFGSDTSGLLHYVYRTAPMLRAAPNDSLDFALAPAASVAAPPTAAVEPLSRRQEKKMESQLAAAREGMRARLSKSKQVTASKSAPPRYDEIYAEGIKALDELAEVEPIRGEVEFPGDIWKSGWRDPHGGH